MLDEASYWARYPSGLVGPLSCNKLPCPFLLQYSDSLSMLITVFIMSSCKMMPFWQQLFGQASHAMHTLMCLKATSNHLVVLQADYCIKVDREWSIDGRDRAANTSVFSPCHMNHSGSRQNVVRSTKRQQRKISFFTQRDIQVCTWKY